MKTLLLSLFIVFSTIIFSQENKKYDYITITNRNYNHLKIESSKSVEFIQYDEEVKKNGYQFNRLLQLVEQYEMEGWNLFSYTPYVPASGKVQERVLMRREKLTETQDKGD